VKRLPKACFDAAALRFEGLRQPLLSVFVEPVRICMKLAHLLTLAATLSGQAQTFTDHPLRRFGTNIYDFSPMIQLLQRGQATNSPYLVRGQVSSTAGDRVEIVERPTSTSGS